MRKFIFRHGKASISHNRFNGHRKPQVIKTTAPDGTVHRMTMNGHALYREERFANLSRKNTILSHEHQAMIDDALVENDDEQIVGEEPCLHSCDDIEFSSDDCGQITWASYGDENKKIVSPQPLPHPWRHPSRKEYLRSASLLS